MPHMWQLLHIVARVAAVLMMPLCFVEAFPSPRGLERWSRVQKWWEDVVFRSQDIALSRHTVFMQEVAKLTTRGFDWLFGSRLISLQSLGVSICCSISSFSLFTLIVSHWIRMWTFWTAYGSTTVICLILAAAPHFVRKQSLLNLWFSFALCISFISWMLFAWIPWRGGALNPLFGGFPHYLWWSVTASGGLISFAVSFGCDSAFIAWTRWGLAWCSNQTRFGKIAAFLCFNCFVALFLVWLPFGVSFFFIDRNEFLVQQLFIAGYMNMMIELCASLVFFILAVLMLAHRIMWPLVSRPLYTFVRDDGVRRTIFISLGLACVGYATGRIPRVIEWLADCCVRMPSNHGLDQAYRRDQARFRHNSRGSLRGRDEI